MYPAANEIAAARQIERTHSIFNSYDLRVTPGLTRFGRGVYTSTSEQGSLYYKILVRAS
jgi:hypothetical protein